MELAISMNGDYTYTLRKLRIVNLIFQSKMLI
ncbi:hypothetical protein IMSAG025_01639 [Muribaculaceae bacterium]|nr:hypothetical protein IMSAG025_01639 [Muribaculaceae bacterium]